MYFVWTSSLTIFWTIINNNIIWKANNNQYKYVNIERNQPPAAAEEVSLHRRNLQHPAKRTHHPSQHPQHTTRTQNPHEGKHQNKAGEFITKAAIDALQNIALK